MLKKMLSDFMSKDKKMLQIVLRLKKIQKYINKKG